MVPSVQRLHCRRKKCSEQDQGKNEGHHHTCRPTNVCFFGPRLPDFKFDNKFFQDIAADAHVLPALTLIRKPVKKQNNISAGTFRFDRVGCDPANTAVPPMQLDIRTEVVYAAALKVHSLTLDRELVVKVALNKGDCKRLLHEISLYEHLGKTVEGMPDVFGGFICGSDNPCTRMVILVMRKHGISLQLDEFASSLAWIGEFFLRLSDNWTNLRNQNAFHDRASQRTQFRISSWPPYEIQTPL
jgi:hypothetical protein